MGNSVDFRRNPYRGVLAEVARAEGVTRQAIQQALQMRNPRITELVRQAVERRRASLVRAEVAGIAPRRRMAA